MIDPSDLDSLLVPSSSAPPVPLRDRLRVRTARLVSRRRLHRRLALAGLAACLALALFAAPWPEDRDPAPAPPVARADDLPPAALEWQALDKPPDERRALFRVAGDLHLEGRDPEAAARCYAEALADSPRQSLNVSDGDSWLLIAIKTAREREKRHANPD